MSNNIYPLWSSVALLIVILAIPLTMWVVKRFPGLGGQRGGQLQIVESLSVGPRERLIVVYTGTEYLLMGATGQQLTLVKTLCDYQPAIMQNAGFSDVLKQAFQDGNNKATRQ